MDIDIFVFCSPYSACPEGPLQELGINAFFDCRFRNSYLMEIMQL